MNYPASPASRGQPRTIFLAFLREIPETTVITVTKYLRTPLKEIPPPSNRPGVTGAIHLPEISRVLNTGLGTPSRKKKETQIIEIFLFLLIRRPIRSKKFLIIFCFQSLEDLHLCERNSIVKMFQYLIFFIKS